MESDFNSGGISGAIIDVYSKEALKHAELYYEEIRKMNTDVIKISKNTNFSLIQIQLVKDYLFMNEHNLGKEYKRFDPSFAIAESWKRLAFDKQNIQQHDITLIKHELKEISLVAAGVPQDKAHEVASDIYNYSSESTAYYKKLNVNKNHNKNITGGYYEYRL